MATMEGKCLPTSMMDRVERRGCDEFIERRQREHKVAGAVTLIARHGKVVSLKAHDFADLESKRAMRVDDLSHLQSMTKPIATVAALQLMERGQLTLSDPVSKFLRTFAEMSVAVERADASGGFDLVPAARQSWPTPHRALQICSLMNRNSRGNLSVSHR